MPGERDLHTLFSNLQPQLIEGEWVFCSVSEQRLGELGFLPLASFRESEGWSIIVSRQQADEAGLQFAHAARMIMLGVHSNLEAVGFLAEITRELAQADISVNPVSAYYHDYLFVPLDRADVALGILQSLASRR